jgi:hypothetical protein
VDLGQRRFLGGFVRFTRRRDEPFLVLLTRGPSVSQTYTAYNYGTLEAGNKNEVTFTLANSGGAASGTVAITLSASSVFTITNDGCTGRSIGPKKSCTVTVKFAPTTNGASYSATLTATGEHAGAGLGVGNDSASIKLEGKGGAPKLAWSRYGEEETISSYNFKTAPMKRPATNLLTLSNSGTGTSAPLTTSLTNESGTAFSIGSIFGDELQRDAIGRRRERWSQRRGRD